MNRLLGCSAILVLIICFMAAICSAQSESQGWALFREAKELRQKARSKEDLENVLKKYEDALKIFETVESQKGKSVTLNNIGLVFQGRGQYQNAQDYFEKSLDIAQRIGDARQQSVALYNMAGIHDKEGRYQSARECLEKSLNFAKKAGDAQGEADTLKSIANLYKNWGSAVLKEARELKEKAQSGDDLKKALKKYEDALEIFEKSGNDVEKATALAWMGNIHRDLHEHPKAVERFDQCLNIYKGLGDAAGKGRVLSYLAVTYDQSGDSQKALAHYEEALGILKNTGNRQEQGTILDNMGTVNQRLGKFPQALEYYEKSLAIRMDLGDLKGQGVSLSNMAWAHKNLGQHQQALQFFEKTLEVHKKTGNIKEEGTALHNMARAYQDLGQSHNALQYYEKSLAIQETLRDVKGQGETHYKIGEMYNKLSQYSKALEHCEKSRVIRKTLGDLKGEWLALISIGVFNGQMHNYEKAVEALNDALAVVQKLGDLEGQGVTLDRMATSYSHWVKETGSKEKMEQTLRINEQALDIFRKTGDARGRAATLYKMGTIYATLHKYPEALKAFQESLAIAKDFKDAQTQAEALNYIGLVQHYLGLHVDAMENFEQSLALWEKAQNPQGQAVVLNNIALIYDSRGQYAKAIDYYKRSLAKRGSDLHGKGYSLHNLGVVYKNLGDYAAAEDNLHQALAIREQIREQIGQAETLHKLGEISGETGKYTDAENYLQKALSIKEKMGLPTAHVKDSLADLFLDKGEIGKAEPFAMTKVSEGRLRLAKGEYVEAAKWFFATLQLEDTSHPLVLFVGATGLGKAYEGIGKNYPAAEENYKKAMELVEEIRSGLPAAQRRDFFQAKQKGFFPSEPAKGLIRVAMKQNKVSESIPPAESTKARLLADRLAQRTELGFQGVPQAILDREKMLLERLAALKTELFSTEKGRNPEWYNKLQAQAKEAELEMNRFMDMLWEKYKAYASVKYPRPVTLEQAVITPNEHVLMLDVVGEAVAVRLLKGNELVAASYEEYDSKELDNDVHKFRGPLEMRRLNEFDPELGNKLYEKLLSKILAKVPKYDPVVIIPDGILCVLPFEALIVEAQSGRSKRTGGNYYEGLKYLADIHPISYQHSLTAMTLVRTLGERRKAGDQLLVVADPVFQRDDFKFDQLPETATLAENLRKLCDPNSEILAGVNANKAEFLSIIAPRLDTYNWVVFATHGLFSNRIPGATEPFLALSDGVLKMSDVMGLKMNADVVALTACQTGLGNELAGEGVMSMGRAFQYAGARSVLMSLWSVAPEPSVMLVESFFRNLKQGTSKLESLRLAREEVRKAGYQHPFFWASFILMGDVQ